MRPSYQSLRRLVLGLRPTPTRAYFESWDRRSEDPWGHLANERSRYEWMLAALDGRRFARALDVGCSLGAFTEMLAPRCDEVLGVDISEISVARARDRLADIPHAHVQRRTLPAEMPSGPFDLMVCADVMCYWTAAELRAALPEIEAALAPGGTLLLVHYRPKVRVQPLRGDEVHDIVARHTLLAHAGHDERGEHRLDMYRDPGLASSHEV